MPTGTPMTYVAATNHRPLPHTTTRTTTHTTPAPKPTGLNWDAIERRCNICGQKQPGRLTNGACTSCAAHITPKTPAAPPAPQPRAKKREGATRKGKPAAPSRTPKATGRRRLQLPAQDIADAYTNGTPMAALAKQYCCSIPSIANVLDQQGIPRNKPRTAYTPEFIEAVRVLYVDQQLTQAQAGQQLGVGAKVIAAALTKGGIPARETAVELSKRGIGHRRKIPHSAYADIAARYQAGESAPAIAKSYDTTAVSIYPVLTAQGITERHNKKTLRTTPTHTQEKHA